MRKPQDCATMAELRAEIDRLDGEIVAQLVARAAFIDRAIVLKQGENLPARIHDRVEDVVTKVRARAAAQGLDPPWQKTSGGGSLIGPSRARNRFWGRIAPERVL